MTADYPEDWKTVRLGEVATVARGASPRPIALPRWFDDSSHVGWVRISDLGRSDGLTLRSTTQRLSSDGVARSRLLAPGTLIMSIAATVGVPIVTGVPTCIHDGFVALENLRGVSQQYLLYVLKALQGELRAAGQTGSQQNINTEIVRNLRIALPPVPEQEAIAEALTDADGLIGALEQMITKKSAMKQGFMQQLLTGETRLPGHTAEWRLARVEELAVIVSGGTPSTSVPTYWDGGVPWCTPTDITAEAGRYLTRTERTISKEGLDRSGAQLLPVGSLLLCTRATVGELKIASVPTATNQGFKSLIPRPGVSSEFLYYKILTAKGELLTKGTGSTFLEVSKRDVGALEFLTPDLEEQAAIAQVLCVVDDELDVLRLRLEKARAVKQGMMQELLMGRTRLPLEEAA